MNEARVFRFDSEEQKDGTTRCGRCNWESTYLYVLAPTEREARRLLKRGEAGLCGNCFSDMLAEAHYLVRQAPTKSVLDAIPP